MFAVLVRLLVFFPVGVLVGFFWFVLLFGFPVWLMIILVAVVGSIVSLGVNALLGWLLPRYVRDCVRADARRAEMYQGW